MLVLVLLGACSTEHNSKVDEGQLNAFGDSSYSTIEIDTTQALTQITISNITYSVEHFVYENKMTDFISKKTVREEKYYRLSNRSRTEKIEFFDYDLKKVFEITASGRRIELKRDYFITHGLFEDYPRFFELNNYETNESFADCWGKCLEVNVPNSEMVVHFGFSQINFSIDTSLQVFGCITFSINQEIHQTLYLWHETSANYHQMVNINLAPKFESDKISYSNDPNFQKLTLFSTNEKEGKARISGFDIILSFLREKTMGNHDYEKVEHRISITDGEITGENVIGSGKLIDMTLY
jgi:hypothetical protein